MRKSKYKQWSDKFFTTPIESTQDLPVSQYAWNAACKSIYNHIRRRNKELDYNWQHEDIGYILEDINNMIETD